MPCDVLLECPLNIPGKAVKRAGVDSTQRWASRAYGEGEK